MSGMPKLTELAIKNAVARDKTLLLKDEGGLYLEVTPRGQKWWRMRYWLAGKESRLGLGVYPAISLKEARTRRDDARKLITQGLDPSKERQNRKAVGESFKGVALEWHARFSSRWSESTGRISLSRLEANIFPLIGDRPIKDIAAPELLAALRRVESRGAEETARRLRMLCGQIFRYAVASGYCERDPAADLRGALAPANPKHFAALTDPREVGGLLRAIDGYGGSFVVMSAMKLSALTFTRPGELRRMEWAEIDMEAANGPQWVIPEKKMKIKMRGEHIVPLSRQAVEVIESMRPLTGRGIYVFPGEGRRGRPMSENTVNAALRSMGYAGDKMTAHGFRTMASTLLHEQGWNSDVIERQLAHAERNKIKAAYNRAEHLPDRRKMMQAWADYLDVLRKGGRVVPIHRENAG
jgi:integrase